MKSNIIELQKEALNRNIPVTDLLRKSLIVANSLNIADFKDWLTKELEGYAAEAKYIPKYRKVRGRVMAFNPYYGWQPIFFKSPKEEDDLSKRNVGQSIPELENLLSSKGDSLQVPFPKSIEKKLRDSIGFETSVTLITDKSSVIKIIEAVRTNLLKWLMTVRNRDMEKVRMTKRIHVIDVRFLPIIGDSIGLRIGFEVVDSRFIDTPEEESKTTHHQFTVNISGSLSAAWGLRESESNLLKILYEFGKREIIKRIMDGTLANDDKYLLRSSTQPAECPFNPSRISMEEFINVEAKTLTTGWGKVNRQINEARGCIKEATTEERFQNIGLLCREILISLAQAVYNPSHHISLDEVMPSETDAKRMLESFIEKELAGQKNEEARKSAKAILSHANALQHNRNADSLQAALCLEATGSLVKQVSLIAGKAE